MKQKSSWKRILIFRWVWLISVLLGPGLLKIPDSSYPDPQHWFRADIVLHEMFWDDEVISIYFIYLGEDPCDMIHNVPDKCKRRPNFQPAKPGKLIPLGTLIHRQLNQRLGINRLKDYPKEKSSHPFFTNVIYIFIGIYIYIMSLS